MAKSRRVSGDARNEYLGGRDIGLQGLLHMGEGRTIGLGIEGHGAVRRHAHLKFAHIGVRRGVQDTIVAGYTGQDQVTGLQKVQK